MKRINYSSGTAWEKKVCYSRAVRAGNVVEVSGTVAVDENGKVIGAGDAQKQAHFILEKIQKALKEVGADMKDVIRTRIYVTDIANFEKIGEAHAHFFKGVNPASSVVEISSLANDMLVEIEVSAVVGS